MHYIHKRDKATVPLPTLVEIKGGGSLELLHGASHWQLTQVGCAFVITESDFTINLTLAATDTYALGTVSFTCVGPGSDVQFNTFMVRGDGAWVASLNAAIKNALDMALLPHDWRFDD